MGSIDKMLLLTTALCIVQTPAGCVRMHSLYAEHLPYTAETAVGHAAFQCNLHHFTVQWFTDYGVFIVYGAYSLCR